MAHTEQITLAQPATVMPRAHLTTKVMSMMMEIRKIRKPSPVMNRMGLVDRLVIPSMAKESIFFSGYLLSPANRSPRSYSTVPAV